MLKFVVFASLLVLAAAGKSPNGEEYIAKLTEAELKNIPPDVLEDALLDVPDLIRKYGYPVEEYEVQTEDGYVLGVHRIPHGKDGNSGGNRIPVLLMHGFTGSSADWVMNRPERALAYVLADAGYDVWLGNARGNYYSRKHISRDPEERLFWQFDWNELGVYDLPAMIDFALERNGNSKIHYIGHSIGTTAFFVFGSERPEYNDKIISMHALAPIAYFDHIPSLRFRLMAKYAQSVGILMTIIGVNEFLPKSERLRDIAFAYCHEESELLDLCMSFFYGNEYDLVNVTMLPIYMGHFPAGASSRSFVHNAQCFLAGKFRHYDFGFIANIPIYGRLFPPAYPLEKMTAPIALHYSESDDTVGEEDVERLYTELPNPIGLFKVPRPSFNHLDFIIAMDVRPQVYDLVMDLMKDYEAKRLN